MENTVDMKECQVSPVTACMWLTGIDVDRSQDCQHSSKCVNCQGLRFERRKTGMTKSVNNADQQEQPAASVISTKQSSKSVCPSPMMRSVSSRGKDTGSSNRPRSSSPPGGRGMRWMVKDTERRTRSETPPPMERSMSQKGKSAETRSPLPDSCPMRRNASRGRKVTEPTDVSSGSSSMQRSLSSSGR